MDMMRVGTRMHLEMKFTGLDAFMAWAWMNWKTDQGHASQREKHRTALGRSGVAKNARGQRDRMRGKCPDRRQNESVEAAHVASSASRCGETDLVQLRSDERCTNSHTHLEGEARQLHVSLLMLRAKAGGDWSKSQRQAGSCPV